MYKLHIILPVVNYDTYAKYLSIYDSNIVKKPSNVNTINNNKHGNVKIYNYLIE